MSDESANGSERRPLLDLAEIVERRDFIRGPDGAIYYLRSEGLGAIEHHRLVHCSQEHDELMDKPKLTKAEQQRMGQLLEEMLQIVLDAPAELRAQITGSVARRIVAHFQRASAPELQVLDQLASLAEAMRASENSTTAS